MSDLHYQIRRYHPLDLAPLTDVYRSAILGAGSDYYSAEQLIAWSSFPEDEECFCSWVEDVNTAVAVNLQGCCIGFCGLEDSGRIASLFVSTDWQHLGVASCLLDHQLQEARRQGIRKVRTEASACSRPLFIRFGFAQTGVETLEFKGVVFERYLMQADISHRYWTAPCSQQTN